MLLPFLLTTSYSSGGNGVDNLFCRSCFNRTLSPGTRSEYSACLFSSAYNLAFALSFRCLCLALHLLHYLRGIQVTWSGFSFQTGVQLDSRRWWCEESICMQSGICELLPSSACAIRILVKRDWFCLSTSPFAWGHNGVVFLCSIPKNLG